MKKKKETKTKSLQMLFESVSKKNNGKYDSWKF